MLNKKGTLGIYGEKVFPTLDRALMSLRLRYKSAFPDMVILLNFNASGYNYIFQRIFSYPLIKITSIENSNDIMFWSQWQSFGKKRYYLPERSFSIEEKKVGCKEIGWGEVEGFFARDRKADKMDCVMDIKIDQVRSINMYGWGFELIADIISMIAIKKNSIPDNIAEDFLREVWLDTDNLFFNLDETMRKKEILCRWSEPGYDPKFPIQEEIPDFDTLLFGETVVEDEVSTNIRNVGQKCINNIIIED